MINLAANKTYQQLTCLFNDQALAAIKEDLESSLPEYLANGLSEEEAIDHVLSDYLNFAENENNCWLID